ncbi:hypothetical protein AB0J68_01530 [Micromonospora sp. NPDC049580]|uniref:hypothetical protein n=1 Tax=Micromonospora sp. NPDC049580 TaxID=3154832 RepID=UPI00341C0AD8
MATSAQIQAESYWNREIVTPEIDWLGDELCRRTKRPRTAFGSKGNTAHLRGAHRSQEWIKRSRYSTNRTYTVQSGLTADQERHVAGLDFTPGEWGTARNRALMVEQTGRLMVAMKAGQLDEVTELFGTTNGRTVTGYNNRTNQAATSDDSHLDHWHLTIDRRHCRNKQLMERILRIALGLPTEDDDMTPEEHNWLATVHKNLTVLDGRNPLGQVYTRMALGTDQVLGAKHNAHASLTSISKQMAAMQAALLGAVQGLDTKAILARVDQVAAADAERDAQLSAELADLAGKLDQVADLMRRMESGELTAEQVLAQLRELLPALPAA